MQYRLPVDTASILRYIGIALFGITPFFFFPVPGISVLQSKILLVSSILVAGACVYGYLRYKASAVEFTMSPLAWPVLALPVVYTLSAIFSGVHTHSFVSGTVEHDTVTLIVILAGIFFLSGWIVRVGLSLTTALRLLIGGFCALMVIQVLHVVYPSAFISVFGAVAASAFGSWHEVGIIAGLSLFSVLALWNHSTLDSYWRWVGAALVALSVLVIIVVNMADVWFVSAGLFAVYAAYVAYHNLHGSLKKVIVAALAALALAGSGVFASTIYQYVPAKLQILQIEVRPSWQGTFAISRDSIDSTKVVFLGTGPNTFAQQWSLYKPVGVNATEFWNVDFKSGIGFIPTTFVTVGILGLLVWATLLGMLIYVCVRRVILAPQSLSSPGYATVVLGATYLAVFHILYAPTAAFSILMFILLGLVVSCAPVREWTFDIRATSWFDKFRIGALAFILTACIVASFWSVRAIVSDVLVNRSAIVYAQEGNVSKSLSLIQKALLVYPHNDRAHRAAVEMGLLRLGELAAANTGNQAVAALQVSLEATIQHGLAAVSINNRDYQNWLALAGMYRSLAGAGVAGAYDNAKAAYAQAVADNPSNPVPLVQLAQLELSQGNPEDALVLLDRAVALKPDFAAAYFLRSQTRAALDDISMAIDDATLAAQRAPEDALSWYNLGAILYSANQYQDAAQALETAVTIQSNYANALYVLALSYDALGRKEDALRVMTIVAQLNPDSVEAREFLARVQIQEESASE